jgi:hypothetical protein
MTNPHYYYIDFGRLAERRKISGKIDAIVGAKSPKRWQGKNHANQMMGDKPVST